MKYYILLLSLFFASFTNAQVFQGTGGNIPDATFFGPSPWFDYYLNVNSVGTINCDITVCLDISHTYTDDLDIRLISPSGTIVYLSTDNGGAGDNYTNTCFTTSATTNITAGNAPFTGDYVPEGNLSSFNGQNANGQWRLQIRDDDWIFSGTLNSWSIDFTCQADCEDGEEGYTLNLFDSYGDGWDHGSGHLVTINGVDYGGYDFTTGTFYSYTICLDPTDCFDISFTDGGPWEYECSYELVNNLGVTIFSGNHLTADQTIGDCEVGGCTDPVACNYDSEAEEDDGSCFYSPLATDDCESLYCASQLGEQVASQFIGTNINYLTIDITEDGIINELFYDVYWHSHGWGNINFNINNATIALYDNQGAFVQNIEVIGNNLSTANYQNFTNTLNTDINVYAGYSIQVIINSPNWGGGTWESYVNEANISFTLITESINAGNDIQGYSMCYDDPPINLFNFLGNNVDQDGTWSPALSGGYLGTFDPQINSSDDYIYTVVGECLSDFSTIPITVIDLLTPEIVSSQDTICFGASSLVTYSVTSNQGSSYSWSVSGGNIVGSSNGNSIQVDWSATPMGTISNAVVITESSYGCTNSSSIDVTVVSNPIPALSIDDVEICLGESITVSTNAIYNDYQWTPAVISSSSDVYTPNSITDNQITVTVTGDGGCTTSESIDFTVYETPVVNLSIVDSEICMSDSLVLTSNPGYDDYSWTPSTISGSTDVYYPSSSSEDMVSLTVTGDGGCTSTETLDIVVYDLPVVNLTIDNQEICIGESVNLSTTAGYNNYDWTPSSISSNSDTYTPTSLTDNLISVTITADGGCTSSDSVDITIYDLPIVNLSIDDADLCMGESLVVSSNPAYNDYSWTPSSITGNTDIYTPSSSSEDMISLTITGDGGCTSTETLDIVVYDLPVVNLTIDNQEICIGESINLSTTAGYNNYDWTPSVINSNTDVYTPLSLTDNQFFITITGDGSCTSSDSIQLIVNPLPIVEVSLSDSVICLGESIAVNSTSGFVNYDWTPTLINTSNVITPLIGQTNYLVEVTDSNGCISSDDADLVINQSTPINLSVNGGNSTTICVGEEIDLFATPGFDLYTWSVPGLSSNQESYVPSDLSDNQFSVIGTNQFGCNSSASLNITINSIPTPSLISVLSDSIQTSPQSINLCEGISNVKFSSIISSDSNPVEWLFVSGNGAVIESGQNTSEIEVSFPDVEDYILEFREYGSVNCYTPQQIEVKVNPNPVLDVSYVEDCYKDSVFFTNNSNVDTTIQSVSWLVEGLSFDSYNLTYPLDNNSKIFELTIVDVLNCSSSLSTSFVPSERPYVDFYHEPEKITILDPEVSFVNLSTYNDSVSWSFGDNQMSEEWEPIHTYDSLGWFEVILKVQNDEGCADSISKQLLIENNLIYYFPSSFTPDGDGLNDEFGISGFRKDKMQNYQFQITNRWGEIVFYSEDVNQKWNGKTSNGNDAIPGSYLWSVRIVDELGKVTRKFGDFTLMR
ncbi:MAG: gliding motility-associated C-terminal domain-containing protein [Flavobacteriales bacterium]|nr:gliding motility-associated C-terminal domain-containing protein [Flavobacteriales bacterium]